MIVTPPVVARESPPLPDVPILGVIGTDTPLRPKKNAKEYDGPCPFCRAGTDRFVVFLDSNRWICRQCSPRGGDAAAYLMLRDSIDFPEAADRLRAMAGEITPSERAARGGQGTYTYYPYQDEQRRDLFRVVRHDPPSGKKTFPQQHPHPDKPGRWLSGLAGARSVLYRLPELLAADPASTVYIVEGEKCVHALADRGLVATCNPGGAGKWRPEYGEPLRGRRVVIFPDNDDMGREHAAKVARALHGIAGSIAVVDLPGLPPKGDVYDWLHAGHTIGELDALIAAAPAWVPGEDAGTPSVGVAKPAWPDLDPAALHGVAGDVVRAIAPHSEADEAALLATVLTFAGAMIGHTPHALAGGSRHTVNNNPAIVGDTAKGRKGSSLGPVRQLMRQIDPEWCSRCIVGGLSSGEGLIHATRDPSEKRDKDGNPLDTGVDDKRLLVIEEELASVLKVMGREGNTLSAIVRQAWDHGDLRVLTRNNPIHASGAHISIMGHITKGELQRYLTETESGNGFANRFMWICSRRSKLLPDGGGIPAYGDLVQRLRQAIDWASEHDRPLDRDEEARTLWHVVYGPLSEGKPGLLGAVLGRAEAHVLRYSALYALLDRSPLVRVPHLEAALAFWQYAEDSARYIFGDRLGDPVADTLLAGLLEAGAAGMDKTAIHALFGRNQHAARIGVALEQLLDAHLITASRERTSEGGRTTTIYRRAGLSSLNSLSS